MPGSRSQSSISLKSLRVKGGILLVICCAICILIIYHYTVSAPTELSSTKNVLPTITTTAGFDNTYRTDNWTPLHITVHTHQSAFQGRLSVQAISDDDRLSPGTFSPWHFEQTISLDKNTTGTFTINVPHTDNLLNHGFQTSLLTSDGTVITQQLSQPGNEVQPGSIQIGLLSNDTPLTHQLNKVLLPNQLNSLTVSHLDASTLPTQETVMENFDIIVLDNFETRLLSNQQIATLRTWVNQGGILLLVGGNTWSHTLTPLPGNLVPVSIQGSSSLPVYTHILSFNRTIGDLSGMHTPPDPPAFISTANIHTQESFSQPETLLSLGTTPLIVKAHQGSGSICYLAFDPASPPLTHWNGTTMLWQALIQETLGERLLIASNAQNYDAGPGDLLTRGGLVNFLTSGMPQGPLLIGILVFCYLLLLGPVRLFCIYCSKWTSRKQWRVILSTIVIFSTLAYGLAAYQKSVAITENSVSIIRINQDGTSAHTTTYMGILSPQTSDVSLQIPDNSLAEPIDGSYLQGNQALAPYSNAKSPMTVQQNAHETHMTIHPTTLWSLTPVVIEQDQQLSGKLSGHIMLVGNHLVGSITNMISTTLNDVYILMPHNFVSVGALAPQQTREINATLQNTQPPPELTLSDLIGRHAGLPAQYFPFQHKQQPRNAFERHMAMLSALSGSGSSYTACQGPCLTHAIVSKHELYVTGGQIPDPNFKNDYDPLLIQGAAATLIGWADQPVIGGNNHTSTTSQGQHINFIQMPLSISYSGPFNIPLDFVPGNLIDVESYDASAILPGAYSLSTGNVTFELPLPSTPHISITSTTITIPDLLTHPSGPGSGSSQNINDIRTELYNWNTHNWQQMQLNQNDRITMTQTRQLVGPYHRLLVRLSNSGSNQIYFGKPLLSLNGWAD